MQDASSTTKRSSRCDGQASRERLLAEALRLFAENGFAQTSTRAIAQAAGVNISAISYYFGDKEGLHRAAFYEPFAEYSDVQAELAAVLAPELSLQQALHLFFSRMLTPFAQGAHMQQCLRLHLREMVEHTTLWQDELQQRLLPKYSAMRELLTRHLGLQQSDAEIDRLVCAIMAMSIDWVLSQEIIQHFQPALLQKTDANAAEVNALVRYATALIDSEARTRGLPCPSDKA